MAIRNFYINKDRSVEIYMDNDVITIPEKTIKEINTALAKKPLPKILQEQQKEDEKLLKEVFGTDKKEMIKEIKQNYPYSEHPDYPAC